MASDPYVTGKVRDALGQAGGDAVAAQRLLLRWAAGDGRLLRGLVTPFIKGIVAHAVTRAAGAAAPPALPATSAPAAKPAAKPAAPSRPAAPGKPVGAANRGTLTPEALDRVLSQMGKGAAPGDAPVARATPRRASLTQDALDQVLGQLGRRIGTSEIPRGMTALVTPPPPRPKAGKRHEQTLRLLAKVYARKRLDGLSPIPAASPAPAAKPAQPASGKRPSTRNGASRPG